MQGIPAGCVHLIVCDLKNLTVGRRRVELEMLRHRPKKKVNNQLFYLLGQ